MTLMYDIIPNLEIGKILDFLPFIGLFLPLALLPAKDIRLRNHDKL